jgi:hypothetical protein
MRSMTSLRLGLLRHTVAGVCAVVLAGNLHAQAPRAVTLVREVVIGGAASGDVYQFTRIRWLLPLRDGGVVAVESRERRLRVFGSDGRFVRTIGRSGGGPGEFELMHAAGMLGDTIWVADVGLRRATLFDGAGKVLQTVRFAAGGGGVGKSNVVEGLFADGSAWGYPDYNPAMLGDSQPPAYLRLTRDARREDALAIVSTARTWFVVRDGATFTPVPQNFSDAPMVVGAPMLSRLYVIDRTVASSPRTGTIKVRALRSSGAEAWARSYEYRPRELERRAADSVLAARQRSLQRNGGTPDEVKRLLFLPEYRPPVSGAFVATDGTLWLRREAGGKQTEYWIIAPDGTLTGRATVPSRTTLMAATGDWVWGTELDDDDVPAIVRYRVRR